MKTQKKFYHVAQLVRERRLHNHLSQCGLASILGYKNGQFVSNIERGLCNLPYKSMEAFCKATNTEPRYLKSRMLQDEFDYLETTLPTTEEKYVSFL